MGSELLKIDEPIVDVKSHSTLETKNNVFLAIRLIFPWGEHSMLPPSQERVKTLSFCSSQPKDQALALRISSIIPRRKIHFYVFQVMSLETFLRTIIAFDVLKM